MLKVTDSFHPSASPMQKVYFQIDTWQGASTEASGSMSELSANIHDLYPGSHVIYAFAIDAQAGTINPQVLNQTVVGTIAALPFVVSL
jgi:hypothetical protein